MFFYILYREKNYTLSRRSFYLKSKNLVTVGQGKHPNLTDPGPAVCSFPKLLFLRGKKNVVKIKIIILLNTEMEPYLPLLG